MTHQIALVLQLPPQQLVAADVVTEADATELTGEIAVTEADVTEPTGEIVVIVTVVTMRLSLLM